MKTLKRNTIAFLLLLMFSNGNTQVLTQKWKSCYGGTDWDVASGILFSDSTYWVVGDTKSVNGDISFNHGTYDIWLLNINKSGSLISEKTFGGSYADALFADIKPKNDSVFYIAAWSQSIDGDISSNPWPGPDGNLWVLQVNKQGDILWEAMAGGGGEDILDNIKVTNDGGVLLFGHTTSNDGDIADNHGSWDNWLIKFDDNGQKLWSKCYGGEGADLGGSVIQTDDGGYLLISATVGESGGNYDTSCNFHGLWDVWLLKLDSIGNIEWQQCYGGHYSDGGENAVEVPDGYIIIGDTDSDDGDVSGYHGVPGPQNKYGSDIWIFKIDKTGNLLWQKCLGGTHYDFAHNIFTTSDGGFMVVGKTLSNDGDVSGFHGRPGIFHDLWFAKIDSVGNLLWQYCYGTDADEQIYRGVIQKNDWDYVLAYSKAYYANLFDVCVVELYDSTVGVKEVRPVQDDLIRVFPNPVNSRLIIEIKNNNALHHATVQLINITGKTILSKVLTASKTALETSNLNTGMYLIKVQTDKKTVTRKIIVKH